MSDPLRTKLEELESKLREDASDPATTSPVVVYARTVANDLAAILSETEGERDQLDADLQVERDQTRIAQQQRDWATGWAQRLATVLGGLVHGGVSEGAARRELANAEAAGIEAIADLFGPAPSPTTEQLTERRSSDADT